MQYTDAIFYIQYGLMHLGVVQIGVEFLLPIEVAVEFGTEVGNITKNEFCKYKYKSEYQWAVSIK